MQELCRYWEEKCAKYIELKKLADKNVAHNLQKKIIGEVCSSLPKNNSSELFEWFDRCLKDESKKWFAVDVFKKKKPLPESLFTPFLEAAIYERNVSLNRYFLGPCVKTFGEFEVRRRLKEYIANGSDDQKAGAEEVIYWVNKF